MGISHKMLLSKMEQELSKASQAESTDDMCRHIHSLKVLSEVLLENEQGDGKKIEQAVARENIQPVPLRPQSVPPLDSSEKLPMKDGANGDSLFDF